MARVEATVAAAALAPARRYHNALRRGDRASAAEHARAARRELLGFAGFPLQACGGTSPDSLRAFAEALHQAADWAESEAEALDPTPGPEAA